MSQVQDEPITIATLNMKAEDIQNMLEFFAGAFGAEYGCEISGQEKIGGMCFLRHISNEVDNLLSMFHSYIECPPK